MTKKQENIAFAKMLKEFPKAFGRVSFRERLMLRAAFTYVVEEIVEKEIKQLGERCNQLLKDKGDLTDELAKWKEEWQEQVQKATDEGWERTKLTGRVRELEQQIEKMKCCGNCKHFDLVFNSAKKGSKGNYECLKDGDNGKYYRSCNRFEKWELREIKV